MGGPAGGFAETLWTSVLRAKDDGAALGRLVERTWKPLYFYLRRKGREVEAAKDLTQAFFAHLLEKRLLDRVERGRGRFRNFLLAALEHFLANEYRVASAEKRGGGTIPISLDFAGAEAEYAPSLAETAEDLYTRAWALGVLEGALADLRRELGDRFDAVRAHLSAEGERPTYRQTAGRLGISESDVANLLHRARGRLGERIVERVRDTVEGEPGDEVADLLRALGRKS
jgi:RNA polymerase sigma-70 factor (ECF subfamily)